MIALLAIVAALGGILWLQHRQILELRKRLEVSSALQTESVVSAVEALTALRAKEAAIGREIVRVIDLYAGMREELKLIHREIRAFKLHNTRD